METQRRLHRPFPAGALVLSGIQPLFEVSGDRLLAQALADNIGEPIVTLAPVVRASPPPGCWQAWRPPSLPQSIRENYAIATARGYNL
jgi:hypothetical protein